MDEWSTPDEIRDHGKIVTAPIGTPQQAVIDVLTGADELPPVGKELGRDPRKPGFDPLAGHEVQPGREHGDEPEARVTTLVFMGTDHGGDFEDAVHQLVALAENLGLYYITATVGPLDIHKMVESLEEIAEETLPPDTIDSDEQVEERF